MSMGYINEVMVRDSKESLRKLSEEIKDEHEINVEYACYSGNVYDNIIRASHLFDADLIVMGTHGTSRVSEWLFGSNAFSVVNNTTIPVLTINFHSDSNTFKKIVFPFNENLLTLKKAAQVIALAKIFNASILIFGYTDSKMTSALTALRKKGEELARQFKDENIESTFTMSLGEDYADEILEFANGEKADLITVITNRSHNVDKVFKTKPDKKLVNHSEIPVLSVPVG
jgi:nucleotide-binding universal stress UspA family protein